MPSLRYLLLQTRNPDDPMRANEVACFARALGCDAAQIRVFDLLSAAPPAALLEQTDMVLLGGSGHYSAAGEGAWLERALDTLRDIHGRALPTFASCWGFQAMARALGGRVIHDLENAELGTIELRLTEAGHADPLFGPLGESFRGHAGHEDHVVELPAGATLLASSARVANQAYRFEGLPIWCTQFHPELRRSDLLERVREYPEYVERIAGITFEQFAELCVETLPTEAVLRRMVDEVFGAEAS